MLLCDEKIFASLKIQKLCEQLKDRYGKMHRGEPLFSPQLAESVPFPHIVLSVGRL